MQINVLFSVFTKKTHYFDNQYILALVNIKVSIINIMFKA